MLTTKKSELIKVFKKAGLKTGDTILIHSSIFFLGRLQDGLDTLYYSIRNIIGPTGNVIVPNFTYSFRRKKIFNVYKSQSCKSIGIFSEFLRKKKNSVRSLDPLFSMSCIGPDSKKLMKRDSNNCFGKKSTFDKIVKKNSLVVGLGISYSTGLPIFMHAEKIAKVFYRQNLKLKGFIIRHDKKKVRGYANNIDKCKKKYPNLTIDRENVGKILEKKMISKKIRFKYGNIISFRAKPFINETVKLLKKNPRIFIKNEK